MPVPENRHISSLCARRATAAPTPAKTKQNILQPDSGVLQDHPEKAVR